MTAAPAQQDLVWSAALSIHGRLRDQGTRWPVEKVAALIRGVQHNMNARQIADYMSAQGFPETTRSTVIGFIDRNRPDIPGGAAWGKGGKRQGRATATKMAANLAKPSRTRCQYIAASKAVYFDEDKCGAQVEAGSHWPYCAKHFALCRRPLQDSKLVRELGF